MPDSLPIFDDTEHHWLKAAAREWASVEEHINDVLHHKHAAPQTPAVQPVNLAPDGAETQEETMSLATLEEELGQRVAAVETAVHNEVGKLLGDLPAITAEAKQLAGNPFAQVAIKAAEHIAAGSLPLEAIGTVAGNAMKWLDDLAALYNPQGAQQAPAAPAEAPAAQ